MARLTGDFGVSTAPPIHFRFVTLREVYVGTKASNDQRLESCRRWSSAAMSLLFAVRWLAGCRDAGGRTGTVPRRRRALRGSSISRWASSPTFSTRWASARSPRPLRRAERSTGPRRTNSRHDDRGPRAPATETGRPHLHSGRQGRFDAVAFHGGRIGRRWVALAPGLCRGFLAVRSNRNGRRAPGGRAVHDDEVTRMVPSGGTAVGLPLPRSSWPSC